MDKKILLVGLMAFLLIGAVAAGVALFSESGFRGTTYAEPYPVAAEIELTRLDGTPFRLSEMRGKVVLLFFGYTSCPDVCPTTMADLKQTLQRIGDRAEQVEVVYITVDPLRDTPERVQKFVNHFNPDFIGLSGSEAELTNVWNNYGVFREIVGETSAAGYLVNHTARVSVIDQQGNLRVSYPYGTPIEDMVHDLKLLIK